MSDSGPDEAPTAPVTSSSEHVLTVKCSLEVVTESGAEEMSSEGQAWDR